MPPGTTRLVVLTGDHGQNTTPRASHAALSSASCTRIMRRLPTEPWGDTGHRARRSKPVEAAPPACAATASGTTTRRSSSTTSACRSSSPGPGIAAGTRSTPVSHVDLAPTLLELAGLPEPVPAWTGVSLAGSLRSGDEPPAHPVAWRSADGRARRSRDCRPAGDPGRRLEARHLARGRARRGRALRPRGGPRRAPQRRRRASGGRGAAEGAAARAPHRARRCGRDERGGRRHSRRAPRRARLPLGLARGGPVSLRAVSEVRSEETLRRGEPGRPRPALAPRDRARSPTTPRSTAARGCSLKSLTFLLVPLYAHYLTPDASSASSSWCSRRSRSST